MPASPLALVPADTAWVLVATALVLLMTPGLAFFYGGLVRSKNALNTMMMSFASLRRGDDHLGPLRLQPGVRGAATRRSAASATRFSPASVSSRGARFRISSSWPTRRRSPSSPRRSSRARSSSACASGPTWRSSPLWSLAVYAPVCHWVWGGGWLARLGALDFAGGTVVHVNAGGGGAGRGVGARPAPRLRRARRSCRTTCRSCCSAAALLWFGWFGFNAGSALGRQRLGGARLRQHAAGPGGDARASGWPSIASAPARSPRSARPPASSSAWWR